MEVLLIVVSVAAGAVTGYAFCMWWHGHWPPTHDWNDEISHVVSDNDS